MNSARIARLMVGLICGWACGGEARPAGGDDGPVVVEPADLVRRSDLVGRDIIVDDRIRYFLETKRGQGFDEVIFKRTEVPFKLMPGARYARPPSEPNAVARGTLRQVDGRLICEVLSLDLQPNDVDRLNHELNRIRPDDFAARRNWALWAERRGHDLNDPKLEAKGVALEGDALWGEASRPGSDPIALADAAAQRPIPREVREALYHRGFRRAVAQEADPATLDDLARRVKAIFPRSVEPRSGVAPALKADDDPAAVFRGASEEDRTRLNRQLYADLVEKRLNARLAANPAMAVALVEEANRLLPDRPATADRFRQRGLAQAEQGVTAMRQADVEELARTFRDSGQPDRARHALEEWLGDRRKHRLSPNDAEGRVLLAANYEKLLGDRRTAGELLAEADRIDPASRSVADAFLRLGFRKGDAGWYDPTVTSPTAATQPDSAPKGLESSDAGNSLRGLTQAQARLRMGGKPDRVVRSATQGIIVEQWIYRTGRSEQYIIFRIDAAATEPRVAASYSLSISPGRP